MPAIASLLKCTDFETIKIIAEILLNILKGVIPLSGKEISLLRYYKSVIREVISTKTSLKKKKEIIAAHPKLMKHAANIYMKYI